MRIFYALLLLPAILTGQVLPDQIWVAGTHDLPGQPGYGNAIIRFQGEQVLISTANLGMNFESTVAVMPDTIGNILFYTNGCYIANSVGDTMFNGTNLNPGEMADWTCPTSGYAAPLGAMALSLPGSSHLYYLFHMGVRYSPENKLSYGPFYYSIIDMEKEGGKGAVISKNNILAEGQFEPFIAVRHGNGRDWWLVFPEYGTNKYQWILFSATGVQQIYHQEIGGALSCRYIGSSAFSPNGTRYARQQHCGVVVMDIDRCSGLFSNPRSIAMPPRAILGGGVAFSEDGNKLLVATQLSIQQADLTLQNPVLDTIVPSLDIAGTSLLLMQYTSNGKIYLNSLGRTEAFHVIHTPNEHEIGFEQRGLSLPVYSIRSLPNYPNYRLYDLPESNCDTLGINAPMVSTTTIPPPIEISVSPNPFSEEIKIQMSSGFQSSVFCLFDQVGRLVLSKDLVNVTTEITGFNLPAGVYFWEIKSKREIIKSGKLIRF